MDAKFVGINRAVHTYWSIDNILIEIAKCDVVCANCHSKIHYIELPGQELNLSSF